MATPGRTGPHGPLVSDTAPPDQRRRVQNVLAITLMLNLAVMAIKLALGMRTGSLSVLADALHSATDSANNILGLWMSHLASPRPDREHPYGHQKYDAIGALGIAAFLGVACFEILQGAVARLIQPSPVAVTTDGLALMLVVLVINLFVVVYERREGRRLQSSLLLADAHHTLSDVWVTLLVLAGLVGISWGWGWLDAVLAFPVAILVIHSAWQVLKENLPWLVDEIAIAPETICETVMEVPGVVNCHNIASRGLLGRQVFIEMHLIVDATDVNEAHDITEAVEAKLEERYGPTRATIHVEPPAYRSEQIYVD
jgi:cation diffusion facilitator family transporter